MILHLVLKNDWDKLPPMQHYVPESIAKEGFIHCTANQAGLLKVANTFYRSIKGDFLVLEIDETKVNALVKWEAPAHPTPLPVVAATVSNGLPPEVINELGESSRAVSAPAELPIQFPHIYGALNREAVIGIRPILRAGDGTFVGYGELLAKSPTVQPAPQPIEPKPVVTPPSPAAKPIDTRTPIVQAAEELLEATDGFSEELKRLRGRVEAKMASLDEEIAKL